jgi:hypothetical protein
VEAKSRVDRSKLSNGALFLTEEYQPQLQSKVCISWNSITGGTENKLETLEIPAINFSLLQTLCRYNRVFIVAQVAVKYEKPIAALLQKIKGFKGHRLLFCDTDKGRQAMYRHIVPELCIDSGNKAAFTTLCKFIPRTVYVHATEVHPAVKVQSVQSFMAVFK